MVVKSDSISITITKVVRLILISSFVSIVRIIFELKPPTGDNRRGLAVMKRIINFVLRINFKITFTSTVRIHIRPWKAQFTPWSS